MNIRELRAAIQKYAAYEQWAYVERLQRILELRLKAIKRSKERELKDE